MAKTLLSGTFEVCVDSVASAVAAEKGGANRLELCCSLMEGGLTPSMGLVESVLSCVSIPVRVMLRPRAGDFLYSETEFNVILRDLALLRRTKAEGVVIGMLTHEGKVDRERLEEFMIAASPLKVTFHRAFDLTKSATESARILVELGVHTLLTSGLSESASSGVQIIKEINDIYGLRIEVMAGGGLSEENIEYILISTGTRAIHGSCRVVVESKMTFHRPNVPMGLPVIDTACHKAASVERVAVIKCTAERIWKEQKTSEQSPGMSSR